MADIVFNVAKGKFAAYFDRVANNDPANSAIVIVLLKVAEADDTLKDYETLAALLAGSNTEADFTNYARKVLTDAVISVTTPDHTNDRMDAPIPEQTFSSAGGASNNNLVKAIICYDPDTTGGTDANIIPLAACDYTETTSGSDLVINAGDVLRAV